MSQIHFVQDAVDCSLSVSAKGEKRMIEYFMHGFLATAITFIGVVIIGKAKALTGEGILWSIAGILFGYVTYIVPFTYCAVSFMKFIIEDFKIGKHIKDFANHSFYIFKWNRASNE